MVTELHYRLDDYLAVQDSHSRQFIPNVVLTTVCFMNAFVELDIQIFSLLLINYQPKPNQFK